MTEPVSGVNVTMALMNTTIAYGTIAPKTAQSEFISFTGITQNADGTATLTGVTRGLKRGDNYTSSATFQLPHPGQTIFILSDQPAALKALLGASGIVGPASSTDNAVVRFDGTTGGNAQNSGVIIDDSNNVSGVGTLATTGAITVSAVTVPTISSTSTLTNKRVTPRTGTVASSATPTINTDNVDFFSITAQTTDITSMTTNLSGTPTDGQTLWIAITGTAARAITWGSGFEASTVGLPSTTVTTNRLDVKFVWNTATSKWRVLGTA